jgi:hypothetical protein
MTWHPSPAVISFTYARKIFLAVINDVVTAVLSRNLCLFWRADHRWRSRQDASPIASAARRPSGRSLHKDRLARLNAEFPAQQI